MKTIFLKAKRKNRTKFPHILHPTVPIISPELQEKYS